MVERVIVRSKEMKNKLKISDAYIIPAGINLEMFKPMPKDLSRKQLNLPADKKLVLFVGTMRPEKRFDLVKTSVSRLKKKDSSVELVAVFGQPQDRCVGD